MLTSSTGIALSMSCRSDCTEVTASMVSGDSVTAAMARWKRESAWRCSAGWVARDLLVGHGQQLPLVGPQLARRRDVAGAGLDDPAEHQRVAQSSLRGTSAPRLAGRRPPRPVADDGAAAAAAGGLDQLRGAQRRDGLAAASPG